MNVRQMCCCVLMEQYESMNKMCVVRKKDSIIIFIKQIYGTHTAIDMNK